MEAKDKANDNCNDSKAQANANLKNILILSFGCMLLNGAYFTTAEISQIVLESARAEDPTVIVDGYISLAINYGFFALSNFITSSVVAFVGVRTTLVIGSITYTFYSASFVYPNVFLVYGSSALMGFVGACFYVAHGCYLTNCCNEENIGKYLGIYWSIMSVGQLSGNTFVFWKFQGSNHIDAGTRYLVVAVLTFISFLSTVTLCFLGPMRPCRQQQRQELEIPSLVDRDKKCDCDAELQPVVEVEQDPPIQIQSKVGLLCTTFLEPFKVLGSMHMLLLIPPCILNGLDLAYFESILPTVVGFTESFGGDVRKWVGIAGILIGFGSLCGGLIFGTFGDKLVKSNRSVIIGIASTGFILVCFLLYLNHPDMSSLGPTQELSWISPPLVSISLICAFLLGLGDGCYNTQINAAIGVIWPENPKPALSIFRLCQGGACAFGLYLGTMTGLVNQLLVFFVATIVGTLSYLTNECLMKGRAKAKKTQKHLKRTPTPVPVRSPTVTQINAVNAINELESITTSISVLQPKTNL